MHSFHYTSHISAALDKTLTEADTEEIVKKLAPAHTQSFVLGLQFNLPLQEVQAIHSEYLDIHVRFLQIILAFLKQQNPKLTWRVIIKALRSRTVNLPGLADELEAFSLEVGFTDHTPHYSYDSSMLAGGPCHPINRQ